MIRSPPPVVRTRKEDISSFLCTYTSSTSKNHINNFTLPKFTWNLKMMASKRNLLFQVWIFTTSLEKNDHDVFSASSFSIRFSNKKNPSNQETFDRCWFLKPSQALTRIPQRLESPPLRDECAIKDPKISHSSLVFQVKKTCPKSTKSKKNMGTCDELNRNHTSLWYIYK